MPILSATAIAGVVQAVLVNPDRAGGLESSRRPSVEVTFAGFAGDAHAGVTRASCVRVKQTYEQGTEIRNTRQVSILSVEELAQVAHALDVPVIEPEWVGANLLLCAVPSLTRLPPSSRLLFTSGASLVVDMENGPCIFPGKVIERHHPGKGSGFPQAALGRRGVTAWVEREGRIAVGDAVAVHIPPQRIYDGRAPAA